MEVKRWDLWELQFPNFVGTTKPHFSFYNKKAEMEPQQESLVNIIDLLCIDKIELLFYLKSAN